MKSYNWCLLTSCEEVSGGRRVAVMDGQFRPGPAVNLRSIGPFDIFWEKVCNVIV